jgi:hypothetical protein
MTAFSSVYLAFCYQATMFESDILRMAVAGSIANMFSDSCFHFIDVINVNSKSVDIDRLKIINGNAPV